MVSGGVGGGGGIGSNPATVGGVTPHLLRDLFGFSGRLGRGRFITLFLITHISLSILGVIGNELRPSEEDEFVCGGWCSGPPILDWLAIVVAVAAGVLGTWIESALVVKRLHDLNNTGWWVIAIYTLNLLAILSITLIASRARFYITFIDIVAPILFVLVMIGLFWGTGTQGENRYGLEPG
jgi:uncharacterized membrane protein YhaH (DUF805 family)